MSLSEHEKDVLNLVKMIAQFCNYTKSTEFYTVKRVTLICECYHVNVIS